MYNFCLENDNIYEMIFLIILTDDEFNSFKNRDPIILEKIYREHKKSVLNFLIIKAKGNINIANEVVSETFYSMITSAPYIKNNKNIQNWLLKIASRKLCDYFRKEYSEKRKINLVKQSKDSENGENNGESKEDKEILMINMALENIKDEYKKILQLKYIEKKSLNEICEILNKSFTTINGMLVRARRLLKKEFLKISKDI